MTEFYRYVRDGAAIYRQSFATIRAEADLARFSPLEAQIAVRMIHACGMVDLAGDIEMSPGFADLALRRLGEGAPVLCDAGMVAQGITRSRLPANNLVLCALDRPDVPEKAKQMGTTRSAAALTHWLPSLAGAVAVFGNAPTALFHLLEMLRQGAPKPAVIIGVPVGFVGAVESKQALAAWGGAPFLTVHGRRGGSAIAAAAVNALASAGA